MLTPPPEHSLAWYRFIGRILGKALYEGLLVEVAFAGFFLAKVSSCLLFILDRKHAEIIVAVAPQAKLLGRPRLA